MERYVDYEGREKWRDGSMLTMRGGRDEGMVYSPVVTPWKEGLMH